MAPLLAGCATALPAPTLEALEQRLTIGECADPNLGENVECGTFVVPEDRSLVNGRTLTLDYVRIRATKSDPVAGPIFYFQGGPGLPATEEASFLAKSPLRERHDILLMDQRGTGGSHRLGCPGPGDDSDFGTWMESVYQAPYPERCREQLEERADLRMYTTPIAMRDYDEVRQALGYDRVNLLGGSYGSRAGLVFMKLFPDIVRSALMTGLVPFEAKMPLYHAHGAQAALDRVLKECASDAACSAAFPDLEDDLAAMRARLRSAPVVTSVKNPETGRDVPVRLTEQRLLGTLRPMLYSLEMQRQLPLAIHRAARGDFGFFSPAAMFARRANGSIAAGMSLSATCAEDVGRVSEEENLRLNSGAFLGTQFVSERLAACALWPKGQIPNDLFDPFIRDIPLLVVAGSHDPVTPKWMTDAYVRHFPNSRTLTMTSGHSFGGSECYDRIQLQFFATADPARVDADCLASEKAPVFALRK